LLAVCHPLSIGPLVSSGWVCLANVCLGHCWLIIGLAVWVSSGSAGSVWVWAVATVCQLSVWANWVSCLGCLSFRFGFTRCCSSACQLGLPVWAARLATVRFVARQSGLSVCSSGLGWVHPRSGLSGHYNNPGSGSSTGSSVWASLPVRPSGLGWVTRPTGSVCPAVRLPGWAWAIWAGLSVFVIGWVSSVCSLAPGLLTWVQRLLLPGSGLGWVWAVWVRLGSCLPGQGCLANSTPFVCPTVTVH